VVFYTRGLTLSNCLPAVLGYRLTSPAPFSVVQLDSATGQPRYSVNRSEHSVLAARSSIGVTVAFCLSPDLLKYVHSLQFLDGPSPDGVELLRSGEDGGGGGPLQLRFRLPLGIEFDNGRVETVPLDATVVMPSLRLAEDTLDFGLCFVGQPRELVVRLSNPTASESYWHCKQSMLLIMPSSPLGEGIMH